MVETAPRGPNAVLRADRCAPTESAAGADVAQRWALRDVFRLHRWRILLTYGLFTLENVLRLAQPYALGLAINDLLRSSSFGLTILVGQHLGYLLVGSVRRVYDTRAFTTIYTRLATRLVLDQRDRAVDVSCVAARSALSRAFVDFFERDVPTVMRAVYSVAGALVMLCLYDWLLLPLCLGLLVPAFFLNWAYGRQTLRLNARLHDELEREVAVIHAGRGAEVRDHYDRVAHWRIKLSDWEALNCGLMELFILGTMAGALLLFCRVPGTGAGDIFAVFRYLLMFIMALDSVPLLVQQVSRLRDIGRRMRAEGPEGPAEQTA